MVQMDNRSVSDFVSGTRKAFCVPVQMHSILRSKQNLMQIDKMYKREWVLNVLMTRIEFFMTIKIRINKHQ